MPDLPPRQLALCALGALAVILLAAWYLGRDADGTAAAVPAAEPAIRVESSGGGAITVHVAGAVRRAGVYRLRAGSRVDDAVQRAGGATPRAELSAVNLAAKLEDGRQVLVPRRAPIAGPTAAASAGSSEAVAAPGAGGATAGVPLNLNTASVEQLDELDGVGPATAQQILKYRESHGGFGSVEELGEVPGIGEKRLASLREQVRV